MDTISLLWNGISGFVSIDAVTTYFLRGTLRASAGAVLFGVLCSFVGHHIFRPVRAMRAMMLGASFGFICGWITHYSIVKRKAIFLVNQYPEEVLARVPLSFPHEFADCRTPEALRVRVLDACDASTF